MRDTPCRYLNCEMWDKPTENCGIWGIFAPGEDVARLTYFGLYALQHRGQESAGMAIGTGTDIVEYKDMGLVPQVFDEKILSILKGISAIGHVRYSTTGSSTINNAQPIVVRNERRILALAHNGNLINTQELRKKKESEGIHFQTGTDSEAIAYYILQEEGELSESIANCMPYFKGAYSFLLLTPKELVAVRDPYGIRPLVMGKLDDFYVFASETCALSVIGAEFIREVKPGEIIIVDERGLHCFTGVNSSRAATCIFEFIYFARPDSYIYNQSLHLARRRMGRQLAQEHPLDADLVISVPDSSTPAAIGFAEEAGIPYGEGLIKNRYIHRTFIQPHQRLRDLGVKMKLNPLREAIAGKRVVMVDDSIVRGTTSQKIVKLLKDAGAKEVHVRVSSPPIKFPCFYGIDMALSEELIASSRNIEEIKRALNADSLGYLSIEGLLQAVNLPKDFFCLACFNDDYPIKIPKQLELSKLAFESPYEPKEPLIMKR